MEKNFITKLETDKYLIGSFDVYLAKSKEIIMKNSNLSEEEADEILKSMPTSNRAAIVDKENGEYVGYIGLYDTDNINHVASIRFETENLMSEKDKVSIVEELKKYMIDSLNYQTIEKFDYITKDNFSKFKNEVVSAPNIVITNKMLEAGISEETLEKFSKDYEIPRLTLPVTIKNNDKVVGIMGLTNVLWANKRCYLKMYLDKSLGDEIINALPAYLIDDYIDFVHQSSIHNIALSTKGSDEQIVIIIANTDMNYMGTIPYSEVNGNNIESGIMFQHIPGMKKQNGVYIPENKSIEMSKLDTGKKEISDEVDLKDGFRLVSPKTFEEKGIDINKIIDGHIKALQNREKFSIPLGEDKYFLQKGNEKYGLHKVVMNSDYVLLNDKNDYCGYVNVLSSSANNRHAEIDIGISPELQHSGLGTKVINNFYNELFSIGYASVTGWVFEFNNPSIKLTEKVAQLNGIRIESYYTNNKLWDMNCYTKVNDKLESESNEKHL